MKRAVAVDYLVDRGGHGFYAVPSEANHTHADQLERDCYFCLAGWVFLGSIDHDGWEVIEAIRCRRCGGTGRLEDR